MFTCKLHVNYTVLPKTEETSTHQGLWGTEQQPPSMFIITYLYILQIVWQHV